MRKTTVPFLLTSCAWAVLGMPGKCLAQVASLGWDREADTRISTASPTAIEPDVDADGLYPMISAFQNAPRFFTRVPLAESFDDQPYILTTARRPPRALPEDLLAWLNLNDTTIARPDGEGRQRWGIEPFDDDCNTNGVPDRRDIAAGTSRDCNSNGVADECEGDCNLNGYPDDCDIASGTSLDADFDGYPDECAETALADVAEPPDLPLWGPKYPLTGWDGEVEPPASSTPGSGLPFDEPFNIRYPGGESTLTQAVSPHPLPLDELGTSIDGPTPSHDGKKPGDRPKDVSTPEPSALLLLAVGAFILGCRRPGGASATYVRD